MFVDVSKEGDGTSTNWVAESGVLDLFLLLGPTPRQVSAATLCAALHIGAEALLCFVHDVAGIKGAALTFKNSCSGCNILFATTCR